MASDVHDTPTLLARMGGDQELLRDAIQLFLEHGPGVMTKLRAAVAQQDAEGITHYAHTIKGMVANFETGRAFAAAAKMEALGRAAEVTLAPAALPVLETEISAVLAVMERLVGELI